MKPTLTSCPLYAFAICTVLDVSLIDDSSGLERLDGATRYMILDKITENIKHLVIVQQTLAGRRKKIQCPKNRFSQSFFFF